MNFLAELVALNVGLIWAISSLISIDPVRALGGLVFARLRQNVVTLMPLAAMVILSAFETLSWTQVLPLGASGLIGIF